MSPIQLNNLLQYLHDNIEEINSFFMVVDDSQLTKNLAEKRLSENQYLVGVLPNYGTAGANADQYRNTTQGMLMILEKTDYSELSQSELIQVFDRTYNTANTIRTVLLEMANEQCSFGLRFLEVSSIRMEPEWKKADCNGWSIQFDIS